MGNLFIQVFWLVLHPFYVSITAVDYNKEAQRVEISCRIFYDDLETALKAAGGASTVDLINPANRNETDSLIARYLRRHLSLSVNGQLQTLRYLGYEIEDDVAWCYLEAEGVTFVQRIAVDNRVLLDQFANQSNILHVTAYGNRKSTKLDNPEHRAVFEFTQNLPR
ncbi:DUF6702 family protein [Parapedobacter indicus]|uniref:Uncharacterized protein n=1 Tax=Parapedobacter indicus TaxID=1477437 RepID=A0A1I3KT23_9SPHI|nr:DUF6702 family protein [Parapedobacter indicus]PPL01913.1 hypothetical protein CLV26_105292 [Parapedobacter indicus]SFI75520.1 hypothetical protein SAMN05444682_105292 [Parapedobacter indicus]